MLLMQDNEWKLVNEAYKLCTNFTPSARPTPAELVELFQERQNVPFLVGIQSIFRRVSKCDYNLLLVNAGD